jgi:ribosome biogenesis GTPase
LSTPALIIEAHGRHYTARTAGGDLLHARPRGKKSECVVGDAVQIEVTGPGEAVIEQVAERHNLLMRAEEHREKRFAANLDVLAYVVATEPPVSDELLMRAVAAARAAEIEVWLIIGKRDLPGGADLMQRMKWHAPSFARQFSLSASTGDGVAQLATALKGKRTVLAGQSGMGKSSLLNRLVPGLELAVGEISVALSAGKHTTTSTRLINLPGGGEIIDSPGFQAFGIAHLSSTQIERAFPEFEQYAPNCRYYNCRHLDEPACAVRTAADAGEIAAQRYAVFRKLATAVS